MVTSTDLPGKFISNPYIFTQYRPRQRKLWLDIYVFVLCIRDNNVVTLSEFDFVLADPIERTTCPSSGGVLRPMNQRIPGRVIRCHEPASGNRPVMKGVYPARARG